MLQEECALFARDSRCPHRIDTCGLRSPDRHVARSFEPHRPKGSIEAKGSFEGTPVGPLPAMAPIFIVFVVVLEKTCNRNASGHNGQPSKADSLQVAQMNDGQAVARYSGWQFHHDEGLTAAVK